MFSNTYLKYLSFVLLALITATSGCSNTDSENVTTQGMRADINVTAAGTGSTTISVDLDFVDGGLTKEDIELSTNDSLIATSGTSEKTLSKQSAISEISYETTFNTEAENTPFKVSLIRENGENAENSTVTLPAPFDLETPDDVNGGANTVANIRWSNFGKTDSLSLDIDCLCKSKVNGVIKDYYIVNTINDMSTDNGYAHIPITQLLDEVDPTQYDMGCTIDITMTRSRTGELDENYGGGGYIKAAQVRETSFNYSPSK